MQWQIVSISRGLYTLTFDIYERHIVHNKLFQCIRFERYSYSQVNLRRLKSQAGRPFVQQFVQNRLTPRKTSTVRIQGNSSLDSPHAKSCRNRLHVMMYIIALILWRLITNHQRHEHTHAYKRTPKQTTPHPKALQTQQNKTEKF